MSLKGSSDSIYSNNVKMIIFENDPNIEKPISSSWAHWLYIHLVGEWYTEWPFHFNLNPFHSFSDRVNIDYKGQRFRVTQKLGWRIGWRWSRWCWWQSPRCWRQTHFAVTNMATLSLTNFLSNLRHQQPSRT